MKAEHLAWVLTLGFLRAWWLLQGKPRTLLDKWDKVLWRLQQQQQNLGKQNSSNTTGRGAHRVTLLAITLQFATCT